MKKMKKVILAFGAHPDDIEIRAGGTLFRFLDEGYSLVLVISTNCASGLKLRPKEAMRIRKQEARKGAACFGAEILFLDFKEPMTWDGKKDLWLDFKDYRLSEYPEGREPIVVAPCIDECVHSVADLLIRYQPELVLTHSPDDRHPSHYSTSTLVYSASLGAAKQMGTIELWFWEPGSAGSVVGFYPNRFVDISNYIEKKERALSKHKSQIDLNPWMKEYPRERGQYWGEKFGVTFAEAYSTLRLPWICSEN